MAGNENEEEDDFSIYVSTYLYTENYFLEKKQQHLKMLSIFTNVNWNFTLLSVFLNEMRDFIKKDHCIERLKGNSISFNFQAIYNSSFQFSVIISPNITKNISIEVSYELVKNEWSYFCFKCESFIGSRNRGLQKPRKQRHIRYYKNFQWFIR